jgi:hypothetical protein
LKSNGILIFIPDKRRRSTDRVELGLELIIVGIDVSIRVAAFLAFVTLAMGYQGDWAIPIVELFLIPNRVKNRRDKDKSKGIKGCPLISEVGCIAFHVSAVIGLDFRVLTDDVGWSTLYVHCGRIYDTRDQFRWKEFELAIEVGKEFLYLVQFRVKRGFGDKQLREESGIGANDWAYYWLV